MSERTVEQALAHAEESKALVAKYGERFVKPSDTDFALLADEIKRLRQGLWECGGIAGDDQNGDKTPDAMTYPDIVVYAKRAVQELRDDHERLLDELPLAKSHRLPPE